MRDKLEELKKDPAHVKALSDPDMEWYCMIWSGEHMAWWGPKARGYTTDEYDAGVYKFIDAWNISNHAGPEKQIEFELFSSWDDMNDVEEIENIETTNLGNTLKSRLLIAKCKVCGAIVAGSHSKDISHHKELAGEWLWDNLVVEWSDSDSCNVGGCKCLIEKREQNKIKMKELGFNYE